MSTATVTLRSSSEPPAQSEFETPQSSPATRQQSRLNRETFRTSRLLEFCSKKELVAQTGHEVDDWPHVVIKELVDNAIDAAEEVGVAPQVTVMISRETGDI